MLPQPSPSPFGSRAAFCGAPGARRRQSGVGASRVALELGGPPVFPPPRFPPALGGARRVPPRRPWGPRRRGRLWMRPRDRAPSPLSPRQRPPGVGAGGRRVSHSVPLPPSFSAGRSVCPAPPPSRSLLIFQVGLRWDPLPVLRAPSGTQAAATAPGNWGGRESRVREKLTQCAEWRE